MCFAFLKNDGIFIQNFISLQNFNDMFNGKVKLADLKVKSFVTVLDKAQQEQAQGGFTVIKGKKSNTTRFSWGVTIIDTRKSEDFLIDVPGITIRRKRG
jgi:hypothetical protein